jgi:hypothetical protein
LFPTAGGKVGAEKFKGMLGVNVGENTGGEFPGVFVAGGDVPSTTPTSALQLGESKVAQMGVNDAYDDAVK